MTNLREKIRPLFFTTGGQWRWFWQLILAIPIIVMTLALLAAPFFWLALSMGWLLPPGEQPETINWAFVLPLVIFRYLIPITALLIGFHLAQTWLRGQSLAGMGLSLQPGWWQELLLGFALGGLMMGLSVGLSWIMGWWRPAGLAWQTLSIAVLLPLIVRNLMIQIQAGLGEEVVYRGYFMQVLGDRWGMPLAIAVSSLLFGVGHLGGETLAGYPAWMAFLSTAIAGLLYALAYQITGRLWVSIGLHFMSDWLIHLWGTVGKAQADALLLATEVSGPPIMQGPDAAGLGVFDLVGMVAALVILYLLYRRRQSDAPELTEP